MAWFRRLANVFRREELRSEIDEELRYLIEARSADNPAAWHEPSRGAGRYRQTI